MAMQAFVFWFGDDQHNNLKALNDLLNDHRVVLVSPMSGTGEQGQDTATSVIAPLCRAAIVVRPALPTDLPEKAQLLWFADETSSNLDAFNKELSMPGLQGAHWQVTNLVALSGNGAPEHPGRAPVHPPGTLPPQAQPVRPRSCALATLFLPSHDS